MIYNARKKCTTLDNQPIGAKHNSREKITTFVEKWGDNSEYAVEGRLPHLRLSGPKDRNIPESR